MAFETKKWPMITALHYKPIPVSQGKRKVRVIVIHDMEYPERADSAEAVAKYFSSTETEASAHICVDNNSIVQCVPDNSVAYAAPGCNSDGIQIELTGYARQSREEWLDAYGVALLDLAADATAQYCLKYEVPVVHLTNSQLAAGEKGIIGHYQASEVYKKSDHMDPGPNFPWDYFMDRVQFHHDMYSAL